LDKNWKDCVDSCAHEFINQAYGFEVESACSGCDNVGIYRCL